jgi:ubiquinone/menaquinone biosynthesis C-methylase UbiE
MKGILYLEDAHLYDLDNRDFLKSDIPFYLDYASKIQGNILELACGTGRVTIPLAEAGHEVWGLELSGKMLEQLKIKLKDLPPQTSRKIHLIQANMSQFRIDGKFNLSLIPNRAFQLLFTEKDQDACLANVREHLAEDGYFIVDFADHTKVAEEEWGTEEEIFQWENTDPKTGYKVYRTYRKKEIDRENQVITPELIYRVTKQDGSVEKIAVPSPWKYYYEDQARTLLTSRGFRIVEEMGFYDRRPIGEGSEFIFVCKKTSH